jgi:hypothetical protein
MTKEHYEDFYKAAKWSLATLRGLRVDQEITKDGIRYVHVNGKPATDEKLFELAWGPETAEHIRKVWKP